MVTLLWLNPLTLEVAMEKEQITVMEVPVEEAIVEDEVVLLQLCNDQV